MRLSLPNTSSRRRLWLLIALLATAGAGASYLGWRFGPGERSWGGNGDSQPDNLAANPGAAKAAGPFARLSGRVVDERGEPVSGAVLEARAEDAPSEAPVVQRVESGAGGEFVFERLREGTYRLDARAASHARAALPRAAAPGDELRLVLERTATLAGEVRDDQGQPAGGAQVTIAGSGVWPPRRQKTASDGRFAFDTLPGGIYEVRARREGWCSEPQEGLIIEPGSTAHVQMTLAPGAPLRGRVIDAETGKPVVGAEVSIGEDALSATPFTASSDARGGFEVLGLRPRPHRVSVRAAGYVAVVGQPREPGGDAHTFPLRRAAEIGGRIVDERGQPVAGAQIDVLAASEHGDGLQLTATLGAARPMAGKSGPPPLASADNLGVTQGAVPKVPLFGPSSAARASLAELANGAMPSQGPVSDARGRFTVAGIPAGKVQLLARHPGFAPTRSAELELAAGARQEEVVLTLSRGGTLRGRVLDSRGFPISQVRLDLRVEGEPWPHMALSDRAGEFGFDALLGSVQLTAYARGLPPQRRELQVAAGENRELELTLPTEAFELAGRVLDARGFPVAGALVRVESLDRKSPLRAQAVSDQAGEFGMGGLPAPPYRVVAERDGYSPTRLDAVSPGPDGLQLTLGLGAELTGLVRNRLADEPLAGARVVVQSRPQGQRHSGRTDSQGKFQFRNLNPGNYEVIVDGDNFVPERREVRLAGGERAALEDVALGAAGVLSGEVVDRLGTPVFGAEVAPGEPPRWQRAVTTDHAGRFRFAQLPPGDHVLSARHPAAGEVGLRDALRVYAAQETPGTILRLPEVAPAPEPPPGGSSSAETETETEAEAEAEPQSVAEAETGAKEVVIARSGSAVQVTHVPRGSPEARAGLRAGDVLLAIEGERVLAAAQARAMLRGSPGSVARLEIRRGKARKRLKLVR